jgi:hypothetical protein
MTGRLVENKSVVMVSKLSVRMICFEWLMVSAANITGRIKPTAGILISGSF